MQTVFRYLATPSPCGYLPDRNWRLEYEVVRKLTPAEYMERLLQGWRRFGVSLFRPRCLGCAECQPIRVAANRFRPVRSMRRVRKANQGAIRLEIGEPGLTEEKLDLYDRFHAYQTASKGWPAHEKGDVEGYLHCFVENPIPTQEWRYYCGERLVGVGYVDDLPAGLSAIYYFHEPEYRKWSLGTWNILNLLERTACQGVPHLYLGYYVAGCPSMIYKARFVPNEVRGEDGVWRSFG